MSKALHTVGFLDYVIAVVIGLLSFSVIIFGHSITGNGAKKVVVYKDGRQCAVYALDTNCQYEIGNMVVEHNGGRVRIVSADCPRKFCSHSGWISGPGQTIVCVPNKVLIEVAGNANDSVCDAVAF
jgi:hypothetical protein